MAWCHIMFSVALLQDVEMSAVTVSPCFGEGRIGCLFGSVILSPFTHGIRSAWGFLTVNSQGSSQGPHQHHCEGHHTNTKKPSPSQMLLTWIYVFSVSMESWEGENLTIWLVFLVKKYFLSMKELYAWNSNYFYAEVPAWVMSGSHTPVVHWGPNSFQTALPRGQGSLPGHKRGLRCSAGDTAGTGSHAGEGTGWRHQVSKQQFPGGIAMTSLQTEIFPFQSKHVGCYFCQKIHYLRRERKESIF